MKDNNRFLKIIKIMGVKSMPYKLVDYFFLTATNIGILKKY